jgi:multidrug efflux system membrane fusion protein
VNVSVMVRRIPNAIVVPSAAVQRGSIGTFLYAVGPGDTVRVRPVTLGPSENDLAVDTQGLSAGEQVVVDGVDRLRDGATVKLLPPVSQRSATAHAGGRGGGAGGAWSGHGGGHRGKPGRASSGSDGGN